MSFEDRIGEIVSLSEAMKLNVLVWGPGAAAAEHYAKREKIRQEIKNAFKNADVRFSEDLEGKLPGSKDLTLPEQEFLHLAACDICLVLDSSKGAGEEIAHFTGSVFAHKLMILTHEKYKGVTSFPASLREYENQLFYSDEEFDHCHLVDRVLTRIRLLAIGKMGRLFV